MNAVQLLKSLRSLVAYHQSCGLDSYQRSAALRSALKLLDAAATGLPETGDAAAAGSLSGEVLKEKAGKSGAVTIDALAGEIRRCRICPLHKTRKASSTGKGGVQPQLMVIGDWLVDDKDLRGDEMFGAAQDLMLSRIIAAIDLKGDDVFVTNVIKCSVADSYKPDSSHITACLGYLKQQIALLAPKVICTMGTAASQTLLNSTHPLIRLRGRFHKFQTGGGKSIPVMPTFHPSYLLKNPEMKKPTWSDLQAVKRKLGQL